MVDLKEDLKNKYLNYADLRKCENIYYTVRPHTASVCRVDHHVSEQATVVPQVHAQAEGPEHLHLLHPRSGPEPSYRTAREDAQQLHEGADAPA